MILLAVLAALVLGLYGGSLRGIVIVVILAAVLVPFSFWRFGKKAGAAVVIALAGGVLLGALPAGYDVSESHLGMVIEARENYFLLQSGLGRYYVYEKESERELGDFLLVEGKTGELAFRTYESQFDFASYLKDKGVAREIKARRIEVRFAAPLRINRRKRAFLSRFDDRTAALLDAFLFSHADRGDETIAGAAALNLVHLLAVNGVYLHVFIGLFASLFKLVEDERKARALSLAVLAPFLLFSLHKIGVLRIVFLTILRLLNGSVFKRRLTGASLVGITGLVFLLFDHHLAFQASFYLGMSVSCAMAFLSGVLPRRKSFWKRLIVPAAVYLLLVPLSVTNGSVLHVFGLFFQLALLPLNALFMLCGMISLYTVPFTHLLPAFGGFLGSLIRFFGRLDVALPIIALTPAFILVYYLIYFYGVYLLEARRLRHARIAGIGLSVFLALALIPVKPLLTNAVYFINVGQGDSILLHNRGRNVLIDTGGSLFFDMAEETLVPFFRKIGVRKIDLLITTHDDMDHSQAKDSLMRRFPVGEYRHEREDFPARVGELYFDNLNFCPVEEENDRSLVFNVSFMGRKWLFTGDASPAVEAYLLAEHKDIDCDVLKVSHHGSKFSSGKPFLAACSPEIAVISCGKLNGYGHPAPEVLERLREQGALIRRTDEEGTISFVKPAV